MRARSRSTRQERVVVAQMPARSACVLTFFTVTPGILIKRRTLLAGAAAALLALAGCSSSTSYTGPTPTPTTTPDAFTRIYLSAAKDGDCRFLRRYTDTSVSVSTFCADPKVRQFRNIRAPIFVSASVAGVDEQDVDFEMNTGGSSDGTIPSGWYDWGVSLRKTKTGWRVHDDGTG